MGESLKQIYLEVNLLKRVLLENENVGILLYLAKYNPNVTRTDIEERFGKKSLKGLEDLKKLDLIKETENGLSLTPQGIFQLEGLITIAT